MLAGAAAAVGLMSAAAPASADPLSVTIQCESGTSHFSCAIDSQAGGTAPFSYSWVGLTNASVISGANTQQAFGICATGMNYVVQVTITDSLGASLTKSVGRRCNSGPWP
jgi:opacity protein-like surface antigen